MALRGRPYNGRVCSFACEIYALDPLQAWCQSQWRRGIWLTQDEADHNVVCVGAHELVRSKAVRRTDGRSDPEMILAMQVGPWDMKHGNHTQVQPEFPLPQPVPRVAVPPAQVEPELDVDAADVIKYAKGNPMEDFEEGEQFEAAKESKAGGAAQHGGVVVDLIFWWRFDWTARAWERGTWKEETGQFVTFASFSETKNPRSKNNKATSRRRTWKCCKVGSSWSWISRPRTVTETTKNRNV